MPKRLDLTNKKFHRLKVISRAETNKHGHVMWNCHCDCGNEKIVQGSSLKSGHTKSCGCLQVVGKKIHGYTNHLLYSVWKTMNQRCYNKNNNKYKNYGARGIRVCYRWRHSFINFLLDMRSRPSKNHSIDRIDNSKGYSKENCRWATQKQQARNRRNNVMLTFKGKTLCVGGWAEELNIKQSILFKRIYKGWSIEKTLTTSIRTRKNNVVNNS